MIILRYISLRIAFGLSVGWVSLGMRPFSTKSKCKQFEPRHDKTNKMSVHPAKTQISLGIHPVWPESSLCAQLVAKDPSFLHANSIDSDQTGRMPRLIWIFAGHTAILLVLSCRGSSVFVVNIWKLWICLVSEQNQNSNWLVKRQYDNHSPGPVTAGNQSLVLTREEGLAHTCQLWKFHGGRKQENDHF